MTHRRSRRFRTPPPGGAGCSCRRWRSASPAAAARTSRRRRSSSIRPTSSTIRRWPTSNAGDARDAAEKFETIDNEHPYSDYARQVDDHVGLPEFPPRQVPGGDQRRAALRDAVPGNHDAAYAQYLIGESYFRQIPDVTRDQDLSQKAMEAMGEVDHANIRSPNMPTTRATRSRSRATRSPARRCRSAATIWSGANIWPRSTASSTWSQDYQTTRHVEEALHRLTESLPGARHRAGGADGRRRARAQFPRQRVVSGQLRAPDGKGGLQPQENKGSWISRAFRGTRPDISAGHAGEPHRPGHRPHRPARHRFRCRADGADRRDRRRQIHPARCAVAGARRARRRGAGARRRGARAGHRDLRAAARIIPSIALLEENGIEADGALILRRVADRRRQDPRLRQRPALRRRAAAGDRRDCWSRSTASTTTARWSAREEHRRLLDAFGRLEPDAEEVAARYRDLRQLEAEAARLSARARSRARARRTISAPPWRSSRRLRRKPARRRRSPSGGSS